MADRASEAAERLAGAWRSGQRLAGLPPDLLPQSKDDAYAIQDAMIDRLGGTIGGWKVGPVDKGSGRNSAPVPAWAIHHTPAEVPAAAFQPLGEVEIAVSLGHDLPGRGAPYGGTDIAGAIAGLHAAVEVVGSRFLNRKQLGPLASIADLQACAAIVVGEPATDWQGLEVGDTRMELVIDGGSAGRSDGAWSTAEMLQAVAALANQALARGRPLRAGQFIITGARIKAALPPNVPVRVTASGLPSLDLVIC